MQDLFDIPPAPPNFNPKQMSRLRDKYRGVFRKFELKDDDEDKVETTEVMKAISELPPEKEHVPNKEQVAEHNAILKSLYDSNGIKASFDHDKVEQPLLDRKIVRDGANMIAQRALAAVKKSSRERSSHHVSEPTWTGRCGGAGALVLPDSSSKIKRETKVKSEPGDALLSKSVVARASVASSDILHGLRQLAVLRSDSQRRSATQADDAQRLGLSAARAEAQPVEAAAEAVVELHESDRRIAELILQAFLDTRLAGPRHSLTTGQVLTVSKSVAAHHADLFKSLLRLMCELARPSRPNEPGIWTLRQDYWPASKKRH